MSKKGRAVIIGGGIAGLLAARVLIDEFDQVFLIERDRYPDEPAFRAGVPQSRHVHNLLLRGQHILEELFPGITAKLIAQGAVRGNLLHDVVARYPSGWIPHPKVPPASLDGYFCSRPLIEWQVRKELQKYDQLRVMEAQEVVGLVASADKRVVVGVQVRARLATHPDSREVSELPADLVVDASGRDSQAPRWLESLGYPPPSETTIKAYLGYATRVYTPAANPQRDFAGLIITSNPPKQLRGGVIWPCEGGRWWVVLAGAGKDYPPTDPDGFLAFAKTLDSPRLYEEMKAAQPESPIYGYRRTENCLREFIHLPERFVAIGDAVCALNPVYGQGMTTAAEGVMLLRNVLRAQKQPDLQGFSRRFHKAQSRLLKGAWQLASASDYRVPGFEAKGAGGSGGRASGLVRGYFDAIASLLPSDPVICLRFLEVINMLRSPGALFHPAVVSRVALDRVRRRSSRR